MNWIWNIFLPTQLLLLFHIISIKCENLTSLLDLTTIGQKQCTGECYDHGSCKSFTYNRCHLECSLFINTIISDEDYVYNGEVQTGLRSRGDINTVEAGPCFGHECAVGSTCYVLKNRAKICLETECVIPPPSVLNASVIDASTLYKLKDSVHYECMTGYLLVGNNTVVCRAGGQWSKVNFACKDCDPPLVVSNAHVNIYTGSTIDKYVSCLWDTGYQNVGALGSRCKSDVTCPSVYCGPPLVVSNAHVNIYTGSTIDKYVSYLCDPGYQKVGALGSRCKSDVTWTIPSNECLPRCAPFPDFPNSVRITQGDVRMLNVTANYTCNIGYEPEFFSVTCVDNLISNDTLVIWSDPTENCAKVDCGPPLEIVNANYGSGNVTTYLETKTYTCDNNMTMTGDIYNSTCQANKTWTETNFLCGGCGEFPVPVGAVDMTVFRGLYSSVNLICTDDYITTGSLDVKCENGTWDIGNFTCWWKDCGQPSDLPGGQLSFSGTEVGFVTTHSCRNGYVDVANVVTVESTCLLGGNWSTVFINCSINCYSPPMMLNAHHSSNIKTYHGSVVYYTCESRFTMVGDRSYSTCLANGNWTSPDFECVPDCGLPANVSNAEQLLYNSTLFMSGVMYECVEGFTMVGQPLITCQNNSVWTSAMFMCVECAYPPYLNDTSIQVTLETGSLHVLYSCNGGNNVIGNVEITCQNNQTWSEPLFFCSACADPPSVLDAVLQIDLVQSDSLVAYNCNGGFYSVGDKYIHCQNDLQWSAQRFLCSPCAEPPAVQNGTYTVERINSQYVVQYQCDSGLRLIGNDLPDCQSDTNWTKPTLLCTECPNPPSSANALINVELLVHDQPVVTYKCDDGHNLFGFDQITCQGDSTWTDLMFVCVLCSNPPTVPNAVFALELAETEKFQYNCSDGFNLIGDNPIQCQPDATWTNIMFTCTICQDPQSLEHATYKVVNTNVLRYECNSGLGLVGNATIECQPDANWTYPRFICTGCSNPPQVTNAMLDYESIIHTVPILYYTCDVSYNMFGSDVITCQSNSTWTKNMFICTVCQEPPRLPLTSIQVESFQSSSIVQYHCNGSLNLIGDGVIYCWENASWSTPAFICSECPSPPSVTSAEVINDVVDITRPDINQTVMFYKCNDGFKMIGSQIITCQNDSTWTEPMCVCTKCPEPPEELNATFRLEMSQSERFQYECDDRLNMIGQNDIQCQSNGSWTNHMFICSTYQEPPELPYTSIQVTTLQNSSIVQYRCNGSLNLIGDGVIYCQNNTSWSTPSFVCSTCPYPPQVLNATFRLEQNNSHPFQYECDDGLNMIGQSAMQCQPNRTWTNHMFICSACQEPPELPYTSIQVKTYRNPSIVQYRCNDNLNLIGDGVIYCQNNASWTTPAFICSKCPNPPSSANALINVELLVHDQPVVTYKCDDGHNLFGFDQITCQGDSTWTDLMFVCVLCSNPPTVPNAVFALELAETEKFQYNCSDGFNLIGDNPIQCQPDATWTNIMFTCTICQDPQSLEHATYKVVNTNVLRYECNSSLGLVGNATIECQPDANWTYPRFICTGCPNPPQVTNAMLDYESIIHTVPILYYTCDVSYNMFGSDVITCQSNSTWTKNMFICTVCQEPPRLPLTSIQVESFQSSSIVQYHCNGSLNLIGDGVIYCWKNASWSTPAFICSACPYPPQVLNATFRLEQNNSHPFQYECDDGLNMIGQSAMQCQPNRTWTNHMFICSACQEPPELPYTSIQVKTYRNPSIVQYRCNDNLNLIGDGVIYCQNNASWTTPAFICSKCSTPPSVTNAEVINAEVDINMPDINQTVMFYKCDDGFNMIGSQFITCQNDSTWTHPMFVCTKCPEPPEVLNATFRLNLNHSARFQYECDDGLTIIGDSAIQCQHNGSWTNRMFACNACQEPPEVPHTSIIVETFQNSSIVQYRCDNSLNLIGDGIIYCQNNTSWSTPSFLCSLCPFPPQVYNAIIRLEQNHSDPFQYECDDGLNMIGQRAIQCQPNRSWTNDMFICSTCQEPPEVPYTSIQVETLQNTSIVQYHCNDSLNLIGDGMIYCQNSTAWTTPSFICSKCPEPPSVTNAEIDINMPDINQTVLFYKCHSGFNMIGSEFITCQNYSTWTQPMFVCTECPEPPEVLNATFRLEMNQSERLQYECDDGLNTIGESIIQCQLNGSWTNHMFICSKCTDPPDIRNTTVHVTDNSSVVYYECDTGFHLLGDNVLTCINGSWSSPSLICNDCGVPPAILNANVTVEIENDEATTKYICNNGYNMTGTPSLQCQMGDWIVGNFTCISA